MIPGLNLGAVETAIVALAVGSVLVGLYVALQAYRALRRYDSRQMLYLSVGMILLFGCAYLVAAVGTVLLQARYVPIGVQDWFRLVVRLLQFVGLLAIAYSLHLRE